MTQQKRNICTKLFQTLSFQWLLFFTAQKTNYFVFFSRWEIFSLKTNTKNNKYIVCVCIGICVTAQIVYYYQWLMQVSQSNPIRFYLTSFNASKKEYGSSRPKQKSNGRETNTKKITRKNQKKNYRDCAENKHNKVKHKMLSTHIVLTSINNQ